MRLALAAHPQVDCVVALAGGDGLCGQPELALQFVRARLHHHRARGGARLGFLVDDRDFHALVRKPQGQQQAGRSRAGDGYVDLVSGALRLSIFLRG